MIIKYVKYNFQHLLPLPGFLLLSQNIYDHFISSLQSKPLVLQTASGEIDLIIPSMIAYLIGYVVMQVRPSLQAYLSKIS